MTKLKCADIEWFLTHGQSSPFHYRRYVCVSNLSWGLLPWEADLVAMSSKGFLTEIEIKVSLSDLKRDAAKKKHARWHSDTMIRKFIYAMPLVIWEKVQADPPIPEYAGVIAYSEDGQRSQPRMAKGKPHARTLTVSEQLQFSRLGAMRYFSRLPEPAVVIKRRALRAMEEAERMSKWYEDVERLGTEVPQS